MLSLRLINNCTFYLLLPALDRMEDVDCDWADEVVVVVGGWVVVVVGVGAWVVVVVVVGG